MANYKDMYHKLLSAVCETLDSVNNLKKAVISAEEIYISSEETIIEIDQCQCKDESSKDEEKPK